MNSLQEKTPSINSLNTLLSTFLQQKNIEIPKNIPEKYQTLLKGLLTRDYEKRWNYQQVHDWLNGKNQHPRLLRRNTKRQKTNYRFRKNLGQTWNPQRFPLANLRT
jgi:hypothetical protein